MNQDDIFFNSEGDQWFIRNQAKITERHNDKTDDPVLTMIDKSGLKPNQVLEIGCSNGWRLDLIKRKYGVRCVGVEPSLQAVEDGQKNYPSLELYRGRASALPIEDTFDLVVVPFVLHWVARDELLHSVAEVDRVVADQGFLIISDFAPDWPMRVPYHHLPNQEVYTYKMNYSEVFIATGLYQLVAHFTFNHDCDKVKAVDNSASRGACTLLRKSSDGFTSETEGRK